jgi:hypothetical protein
VSEYFDLATINTAIESTLADATGLNRAQDLAQLTENIPEMDLPLLQVVPTTWSGASGSATHVNTFGGKGTNTVPIKRKQWVYTVFVYISTLANFAQGMSKMAAIAAAVTEVLDAQEKDPLFGKQAIRSFTYMAERGTINYSNVDYIGCTFTLTLELW